MSVNVDSASPSGSAQSESDDDYDVEHIRKWRYNRTTKTREFYIKWCEYDEKENTWEPEANLNCPEAMENFEKSLTKQQLACLKARKPSKLKGLERNAEIKCIAGDASLAAMESLADNSFESDDCKFVCMILFDDDDQKPEEVSIDDLFCHRPDEAFDWIERRLVSEDAVQNRRDVLM